MSANKRLGFRAIDTPLFMFRGAMKVVDRAVPAWVALSPPRFLESYHPCFDTSLGRGDLWGHCPKWMVTASVARLVCELKMNCSATRHTPRHPISTLTSACQQNSIYHLYRNPSHCDWLNPRSADELNIKGKHKLATHSWHGLEFGCMIKLIDWIYLSVPSDS